MSTGGNMMSTGSATDSEGPAWCILKCRDVPQAIRYQRKYTSKILPEDLSTASAKVRTLD